MNATMRAAQEAWQNLPGFIAATHLSLETAGIQLCLVQRRLVPAGMMHQGQETGVTGGRMQNRQGW